MCSTRWSVLALRKALDISEDDLETGPVSIRREYERNRQGDRVSFKNFVVNRSVHVRQRDLTRFDEFLDSLVARTDMEVRFSYT